ncbi:MAG: hypothetical protein AAF756_07020 [Pseudomonadota bacterium]
MIQCSSVAAVINVPKTDTSSQGSLRERLNVQAEAARAAEKTRSEQASASAEFYRTHLRERLLRAADYFQGIVEDLQTIQFETSAMYPFGPSGERDVLLKQHDFLFSVDDPELPKKVSVACTCDLKLPVSRTVQNLHDANEFEDYLRETGIRYYRHRQTDLSSSGNESSRFTVEGSLTAGFHLQANPEKQGIDLHTLNLERLPTRSYLLQPERVEDILFERLGRLLLREIDSAVKTEVSPEVRKALQAKAAQRQRERAQVDAQSEAASAQAKEGRASRHAQIALKDAGKKTKKTLEELKAWAERRLGNRLDPRE